MTPNVKKNMTAVNEDLILREKSMKYGAIRPIPRMHENLYQLVI